jgi:hypothetical protein
MPIHWNHENDRKLLLLMIKTSDMKVNFKGTSYYTNLTQDINSLWGANAPTTKSISLRYYALKKLAQEQDGFTNAKASRKHGLATPRSSPKAPKRSAKEAFEQVLTETTPRRQPKRKAAEKVTAYIDHEDESEDEGFVKEEEDFSSDYTPGEEDELVKGEDEQEIKMDEFKMEESAVEKFKAMLNEDGLEFPGVKVELEV